MLLQLSHLTTCCLMSGFNKPTTYKDCSTAACELAYDLLTRNIILLKGDKAVLDLGKLTAAK